MLLKAAGARTRQYRSSVVRQTDLLLFLWSLVSIGGLLAVVLSELSPGVLGWLSRRPSILAAIALGGGVLLLGLRFLFLKDDFRLVTDEATYFFLSTRAGVLLCRRVDILAFREEDAALHLETTSGAVNIEAPIHALILVENLLVRWAAQEGRPQDPPHTPPYAR
jgi:hypothetical protein